MTSLVYSNVRYVGWVLARDRSYFKETTIVIEKEANKSCLGLKETKNQMYGGRERKKTSKRKGNTNSKR